MSATEADPAPLAHPLVAFDIEVAAAGIVVEDTPQGPSWHRG